jgi:hypothetical protein
VTRRAHDLGGAIRVIEHRLRERQLDGRAHGAQLGTGIPHEVLVAQFEVAAGGQRPSGAPAAGDTESPVHRRFFDRVGPAELEERAGHVASVTDEVDEHRFREQARQLAHVEYVDRRLVGVARLAPDRRPEPEDLAHGLRVVLGRRRRERGGDDVAVDLPQSEPLACLEMVDEGAGVERPVRGPPARRELDDEVGLGRDGEVGMTVAHRAQHGAARPAAPDDERERRPIRQVRRIRPRHHQPNSSDEVLAQDLAERAAGDLIAEFDDPRHLERRQLLLARRQQVTAKT